MLIWLSENMGTMLVIGVVVALMALAIWSIRRDRKRGKSSCGGSCAGCPMGGCCHAAGAETQEPKEETHA